MLLDQINSPADLKKLEPSQLVDLSKELKEFFIEMISHNGGHFASSLGVLELTVALHYVLSAPKDLIVWDVGHQSYIHKILTERKKQLKSIRKFKGLRPFPSPLESKYDAFAVGHAGTSISAALGMAYAQKYQKKPGRVVAVIGDGGATTGMSFEAINHACSLNLDILIILNDNQMSISPNVGALNNSLSLNELFKKIRKTGSEILPRDSLIRDLAKKIDKKAQKILAENTVFSALGCDYHGPIDGHDILSLVKKLKKMTHKKGVVLLHVITRKGYGYKLAEENPVDYHGVAPFDSETGIVKSKTSPKEVSYSQLFSKWILHKAKLSKKLVGITPAMATGSGLTKFSKLYEERFFDVGIAEQHAITFAAGIAKNGLKPVVAIYSTFLQRGYDQCLHDVLLQNLDVLFAIDRAGLVGGDGATHHGIYDIAFLRALPNAVIMTPSDEEECWKCLNTGYHHPGPAFVRYPRGNGTGASIVSKNAQIKLGTATIVSKGSDVALFAFGPPAKALLKTAKQNNFTLIDMRFVKPLDTSMIKKIVKNHSYFISIEEHLELAGAGSAVAEYFFKENILKPFLFIGIPDRIIEHGTQAELYGDLKLDDKGIEMRIKKWLIKVKKLV